MSLAMSRGDNSFSQIVKCSHCKKIITLENFESHTCDLSLKECKRIEVVYFQDGSYKNNKLMTGWGTDGILYTFEVVPRKPIPITIPLNRRIFTRKKTDEDFTEPCSTRFISVGVKDLGACEKRFLHCNMKELKIVMYEKEMHSAVCADCGKECTVPFKPDGSRPVYCRECYAKHRPQRRY